jgi:malate synthase
VQQTIFDNGNFPAFPQETKDIRTSSWTASIPRDLQDRREITGPVDRKMIINALNSGAKLLWLTLKTALHLHGKYY